MNTPNPLFPLNDYRNNVITAEGIARDTGYELTQCLGYDWFKGEFRLEKTQICPECGQNIKAYFRKLKFRQIRELMALWKAVILNPMTPWHHWATFKVRNDGEFAKMAKFSLVHMETNPDGSDHRGYWNITDLGRRFLMKQLHLPKNAIDLHGKVICYTGPEITVEDAWEAEFDYDEMMGVSLIQMMEWEENNYFDDEGEE